MSVYEHLWKMVQQSSYSSANGKIAEYFSKTFYSFDEFIKNVMAFMIILKNFGS